MSSDKNIAIGIDIGGSHISCGAVDLKHNSLVPGTGFGADVDNKASAEAILNTWAETMGKTLTVVGRDNVDGIGFAMPGPFDYTKGIALFEKVEKYLNLYGLHVGNEIRSRLELPAGLPVRFINDATAFAIAEAWIGEGHTPHHRTHAGYWLWLGIYLRWNPCNRRRYRS
jgi:glucokinase